jgi:hypothetical protein
MLSVYTRHSQKCPHQNDIAWRRCRCPKWIQGTPSEDHEFLRTSAATRTWEQAEEKARKLEEEARPGARKTAPAITIAEAVAAYRADEAARCLSKSTTNQSKTLFQFHLPARAKDVGLTLLRELTTPSLVKFRATWGNGPNTSRSKGPRGVAFQRHCDQHRIGEWPFTLFGNKRKREIQAVFNDSLQRVDQTGEECGAIVIDFGLVGASIKDTPLAIAVRFFEDLLELLIVGISERFEFVVKLLRIISKLHHLLLVNSTLNAAGCPFIVIELSDPGLL